MSILNKIKNKIPYVRKPKQHGIFQNFLNQYEWAMQRRDKQTLHGIRVYYDAMCNVWINACINVKTNEILNLGWNITNIDNDKTTSQDLYAQNLLKKPLGYNGGMNFNKMLTLICHSHMGLGDAFIEAISDDNGALIGFQYLPVEYLQYSYDYDCFCLRNSPDTIFEDNQLIHIYNPPVDGGVWGLSPIDILARDLILEILSRSHTKGILESGGLNPRGIIEFSNDMHEDEYINELERLKLQSNDESSKNSTLILKGAEYKDISYSPHDMEYQALQKDIRDRILATYQVPPSKVSIIETANLGSGSGMSQAENFKKVLFSETNLISDEFNRILGEFGFDCELSFNELDIENKKERSEIENLQLQAGVRTINEIRAGYNLEPVVWGDEPLIQRNNVVDVTDSTGEQALDKSVKDLTDYYRYIDYGGF